MDLNFLSKKSEAAVAFPRERRQQKLVWIFFIIVALAAGVLYFGFWRSPADSVSSESEDPVAAEEGASLASASASAPVEKFSLEQISFDASFLSSEQFKRLRRYGAWPLEVGAKGRTNPFLPY